VPFCYCLTGLEVLKLFSDVFGFDLVALVENGETVEGSNGDDVSVMGFA